MKSITLFCTVAMLFYALEIAVTDWKLSNISPRLLTLCYALGVAICSGISLCFGQEEIRGPQGKQWIFVLLMVLASFVAASSHFQALHEQSGAVKLTMFYCLLPVAASIYVAMLKGELPNARIMVAWPIAALALYLVSSGAKE
jgi:drug/metabolite transporter (DMT)-like permease